MQIHNKEAQKMRTVLVVFVSIMLLGCGARPQSQPPKLVDPGQFKIDYPGKSSSDEARLQTAIGSFEPLIYGHMTDPILAAKKISAWRPIIARSSKQTGVPADLLGGLIFLESGGNRYAISPAGCVGPCQLSRLIANAYRKDLPAIPLGRVNRKTDWRCVPAKSIPVAARYLAASYNDYGRWDFAFAAYHMGGPNLQRILKGFVYPKPWLGAKRTIENERLTWAQIVFDVSPSGSPKTFAFLRGLGDNSRDYWFRVSAAARAVKLWQTDRNRFLALVDQYKRPAVPKKNWRLVPELVWYPPGGADITRWRDWVALAAAVENGELVELPNLPESFGFAIQSDIGRLDVGSPKYVYATLRPSAAGLLCYIASAVRRESGDGVVLAVSSATRSVAYHDLLKSKGGAPLEYSAHCAGVTVDFLPPTRRKARQVFEYVLEDLKFRVDIAWMRENAGRPGEHYHITLAYSSREKFAKIWKAADSHWQAVVSYQNQKQLLAMQQSQRSNWSFGKLLWLTVKIWFWGFLAGVMAVWFIYPRRRNETETDYFVSRLLAAALWWLFLLLEVAKRLRNRRAP